MACVLAALSWYFVRTMGLTGLLLLSGGLLGSLVAMILLFRFPVVICMIWFLSMSGLRTLGMIRMPGLPDFSFPRLFMILVAAVGAIAVVSGRRVFKPPFGPEILLVVHAGYILWNMYAFGLDTRFNTWIGSSLAPIVGFMFAKNFVTEERHLRATLVTFVLVSVYFWVTCVGERFNIPAIVWPKEIMDREVGISWFGRSRGPYLQPGITGQFLGWYMMAQVFLLTRRLSRPVKTILILNIAMCGVGLFFTYTRGPWLATVCGLLAMGALRPQYRKILAGVMVLGGLLFVTDALRPKSDEFLGERLGNTSTVENRLGFLAAATRMIGDKPLFGIGYFRYLELLPQYNHGTYIPFYGFVGRGAGKGVPIHDMYIGRAAEEGLVSVALFFWLMVLLGRQFRKRWRAAAGDSWFDRDFMALFAGVMVSYLVNGMTLDYRYFDYVNVFPLFMAGIIVGYPGGAFPGEAFVAQRFSAVSGVFKHARS
jgi:O-antigen ligase